MMLRTIVAGLLALTVAACGGGTPPAETSTGKVEGVLGQYFYVTVPTPVNGTVDSVDGRIHCVPGVPCAPVKYAWSEVVTLRATPASGYAFATWAGDCNDMSCVLSTSGGHAADFTVVAVFGPIGAVGHGNYTSPDLHGPAYFKFVAQSPGALNCTRCHGANLQGVGIAPGCNGCHEQAGHPGWQGDCTFCHAFPPATGAHQVHFGLTGAASSGAYGDLSVLQDRYPGATPTGAPRQYAFGCGQCHPATDPARHMDGTVQVSLFEAAAPAGSLKARNDAAAAFDPAAKTCSGVYCHSSGQGESPAFAPVPSWTSGQQLGCGACHGNPPAYPSGPAGSATANTHLTLRPPFAGSPLELLGHFTWHNKYAGYVDMPIGKHGVAGDGAAPMTCQACHAATVDPFATGRSGFWWLNTTGEYNLPGAARTYGCRTAGCHGGAPGEPAQGAGRVLPLLHVNGARDVVFDGRTAPPAYDAVPVGLLAPAYPYWVSVDQFADAAFLPAGAAWNPPPAPVAAAAGTISFRLDGASYEPATKTCTSVACHLAQTSVAWGDTPAHAYSTCFRCHTRH
jgi:predicted CxxxxCH...CXXCH cytochrome family protein